MATSPTDLFLPQSLPYPLKITSIDVNTHSTITRGTRLLSYSFVHIPRAPGSQPETRFGTWEAAIEGTVDSWKVNAGDVISQRKARERPVLVVIEPCKHGMQLGGLCVLCGKDMTNSDYTGFSDASRASIQMTHSAFGPTVSLEEAQRIERETAEHLLKSRKLSLIVDLDQTIVHATVDPTVGEWITEGESWEARHVKKGSTSKRRNGGGGDGDGVGAGGSGGSDGSDDSSSDSDSEGDDDDECNPNWEALKDVKKFRLGPESFMPPTMRGPQRPSRGKAKAIENEGCMYYIKPRPGWKEFLRDTATKYEMHVYTMGTRAYAEEVCAAIDPDGKIFGGRLLSRDESGSLTQKSLQRLFPCDTSMVVIIDDRADVWEWSPNLIKVIPYDFFVGIGDINSTFLPKIEPLTATTPSPPDETKKPPEEAKRDTLATTSVGSSSPATPEETEQAALQTNVMLTQNSLALEAQLEERPLAKKQEELQVASEVEAASAAREPTPSPPETTEVDAEAVVQQRASTPSPKPEKIHSKPLLKNDDQELERVGRLLDEVHQRFFTAYDRNAKRPGHGSHKSAYNVTRIIPTMRSEVLEGIHLLFSSVIPLDTRPESTEIWRLAHMFGAKCSTELTKDITHVVAAKRGTVKVDMARKRGGITIVWLAWFTDSIALWKRQNEAPYLLDDPPVVGPSSSPTAESQQISSDPDPDADDWDQDPGVVGVGGGGGGVGGEHGKAGKSPGSLELDEIDWNDINDEVEAAMNESDGDDDGEEGGGDGDDGKSDRSGMRSGNVSEDEWTDESNGLASLRSTPRLKRKRLRSVTPSEGGLNGSGADDDSLRSPLAKRKKLAADRTGFSRLKQTIVAEELSTSGRNGEVKLSVEHSSPFVVEKTKVVSTSMSAAAPDAMEDVDPEEEDDEEEDGDEEDDDDFLARELEEDWG